MDTVIPAPESKTYNGWKNYETWLTTLWLDNDESTQTDCVQLARRASSTCRLADEIKDYVRELPELDEVQERGGFVADLIGAALSEVDWLEIAEHYYQDAHDDCAHTPECDDQHGILDGCPCHADCTS